MRGGSGGSWLRQPQSSAGGGQERVRQAQIHGISAFGDGRPCVAELHQPLGRAPREGGEGAVRECKENGGNAVFQLTDVTSEENIKGAVERAVRSRSTTSG